MSDVNDPIKQTTAIAWYKSNTVRALLLAGITQLLTMTGWAVDLAAADAEKFVSSGLNFVETASLLWAFYARTRQPTPPLTLTKPTGGPK